MTVGKSRLQNLGGRKREERASSATVATLGGRAVAGEAAARMRGLRRREQLRGVGGEGGERSNAVAGPVGGDGAVASVVCVLAIKPDKGGLPTACAKKEGLEPITRSAQGGIFKKTKI